MTLERVSFCEVRAGVVFETAMTAAEALIGALPASTQCWSGARACPENSLCLLAGRVDIAVDREGFEPSTRYVGMGGTASLSQSRAGHHLFWGAVVIDIGDVFTASGLATLGQVIMIDLMLAGDNVIVLGALAAGLPAAQRKRVLALGVVVAMVCRLGLALVATQLLQVVGLLFAGGLLLLWVAWKLFRELRSTRRGQRAPAVGDEAPGKSFAKAAMQIAAADLSMSLDNVLAIAGAAREHPAVLLFGLLLSVTLMGVAANYVARIIGRYPWLAYLGLSLILYVAGSMIYHGIIDRDIGVLRLLTD